MRRQVNTIRRKVASRAAYLLTFKAQPHQILICLAPRTTKSLEKKCANRDYLEGVTPALHCQSEANLFSLRDDILVATALLQSYFILK